MNKILLFFLAFSISAFGQNFLFEKSIGLFNDASSFTITAAGLIYVSDRGSDEIILIDTTGNIKYSIGGFGWGQSAFDNPTDVFSNGLAVYVSDNNNHRIQTFDKDLNFISELLTKEASDPDASFGYPLSCATSSQGDLYILDSENKRVVKFDLFGNFIQNFGSFDAGDYMLINPQQIALSSQNQVFVTDGSSILIFDQYGNGLGKIQADENFTSIRIVFSNLVVTSGGKIFTADLREAGLDLNYINFNEEIPPESLRSALIFNNKLFILTKDKILIFNRE